MASDLVTDLAVDGARLIQARRFGDSRGWFTRLLDAVAFLPERPRFDVVNINNSYSADAGTMRGLHWQVGARAEAKLVRCVRGSVLDVMVDIRPGSPTFGTSTAVVLISREGTTAYVPNGCAHGVLSLEDDSEIIYCVDQPYSPQDERGMRWDDPFVRLEWPMMPTIVSAKDQGWPDFRVEPT